MDRRETDQKWYSSFDEKRMLFIMEDGDETSEDLEIPAIFEVCGTCDGKGKHVNPSIDSNGLTQEDFDEDPDFSVDYFSGLYDVACNECHGNRVAPTVRWEGMAPELKARVESIIEDFFSYQRECYMERRMGC